jgi:hypothetical protein
MERTRFFPRQLVEPDDLNQVTRYFVEQRRRHNRLLHGWGVVCGVRVRHGKEPCTVLVEPGYLLGPFGDDIVVGAEVEVNVCNEGPNGSSVTSCEDVDRWCTDLPAPRRPGQPLYLAIKYDECNARPVRVQPGGCGCDESACEYSRVRDGYQIKLLTQLPPAFVDMKPPKFEDFLKCPPDKDACGRGCPPCPDEPWIILADIHLKADGTGVDHIDCWTHRRYVLSLAEFYYMCEAPPVGIKSHVFKHASIGVGPNSPGTTGVITLTAKATKDGTITLANGNATVLKNVPASIPVLKGQEELTYPAKGENVGINEQVTVTVNAKYNNTEKAASVIVIGPFLG